MKVRGLLMLIHQIGIALTVKEFLSSLPEEAKPDYLAIHVYTTTFESFRQIVENYWNTFRLPIWVTEFAMQASLRLSTY